MIDLSGPVVVAAMVFSGVISLVGLLVNRATTIRVSRERFDFEKTLAEQRQSAELQLAERKFRCWTQSARPHPLFAKRYRRYLRLQAHQAGGPEARS
jgi:hypothetical protein